MTQENNNYCLQVHNLKLSFKLVNKENLHALDGIDLNISQGEIVGLVGESGAGKTVFAHSILRIIPPDGRITEGQIIWKGRNILKLANDSMRDIRGKEIAMIFQNPQASLNPVYSIGKQLIAVIQLHRKLNSNDAKDEAVRLLKLVYIPDATERLNDYPHQFSGGMCQRIMIAMALACQPSLLIADEPSSSLDVTIQAQLIDLLSEIREKFRMAILFITHDLGVVAQLCDRVAVMLKGRIIELGSARDVYGSPKHPYTKMLLDSVPIPDPNQRRIRTFVTNEGAYKKNITSGCSFRFKCPHTFEMCKTDDPKLSLFNSDNSSHTYACWLHNTVNSNESIKIGGNV